MILKPKNIQKTFTLISFFSLLFNNFFPILFLTQPSFAQELEVTPSPTPVPTEIVTQDPTPTPDQSPTPSDIPSQTPSDTPTDTPIDTPTDTSTPTPTPTDDTTPTSTDQPTPTDTLSPTLESLLVDTPTSTEELKKSDLKSDDKVLGSSTSGSTLTFPDDCNYNCSTNDLTIYSAQLVKDTNGQPLNCILGDTTNAHIKISYNNHSNTRYALYLTGDIYQNDQFVQSIQANDTCLDTLNTGIGEKIFNTNFTFICGQTIAIKNIHISWDSNTNNCSSFFINKKCNPPGQSYCNDGLDYIVTTPLIADFSATSVCLGNQTQFTDQTTGGVQPYSYQWNFGLGNSTPDSTNSNPTYIYTQAGIYNVNLLVGDSSSQSSNSQKSVTVFPKPSVDFSFLVDKSCTDGGRITNFSTDTTGQLIWTFGDGTTSVVTNPSHLYKPGTYHASLSVIDDNGCQNVVSKDVFIPACTGTLVVEKKIINDNGATATYSDFSFIINSGSTVPFNSSGQNIFDLPAGDYTVTEDSAPSYQTSYSNCQPVTVSAGSTTTCTITNDDLPPQLTLKKIVNTGWGSTAVASDFTLSAIGDVLSFSGPGPQVGPNIVQSGITYTLSESGPTGFEATVWTCDGGIQEDNQIVLSPGQFVTCTITNTPQPSTLIVKKIVDNTHGGTLSPPDFYFQVNGGALQQFEPDGQNEIIVNSGVYTVTESPVNGYTPQYDKCSNIVVGNGSTATCTITNQDLQAKLTVIKVVNNGPAGGLSVSDFPLFVSQVGGSQVQVTSGFANLFDAGSYQVNEDQQVGYIGIYSGDCDSSGFINLSIGDSKTCTITNTRLGTIAGMKVNDKNADGVRGNPYIESPLSGWTIYLFSSLEPGSHPIATTTTQFYPRDTFPQYKFEGLQAGRYYICEENHPDWYQTYPTSGLTYQGNYCRQLDLAVGQYSAGNDFLNYQSGTAQASKFNDLDGNGIKNSGDYYLSSWTFFIDENSNSILDPNETFAITGADGRANLPTKTYRNVVCEVLQAGWLNITPLCQIIYVESGRSWSAIFGNYQYGSISGTKFEDLNGDGQKDVEEPGLPGWTIYLDLNNNGVKNTGEPSVVTDINGNYSFTNLLSRTYRVREINQLGWTQTTPAYRSVTVTSGTQATGIDFGNFKNINVTVCKHVDNLDNPYTQGWIVTLNENSQTTGRNGCYTWTNIGPGQYSLTEAKNSLWTQLVPGDWSGYNFQAVSGQDQDFDFVNFQNTTITACKIDTDEKPISNWPIYLDKTEKITDQEGCVNFEITSPGDYLLSEYTDPNWTAQSPTYYNLSIKSGDTYDPFFFTNFKNSTVEVTKFNDLNGNGEFDENEPTLPDWQINLGEMSQVTDQSGKVQFNFSAPGVYQLSEDQKPNWSQTAIYCIKDGQPEEPSPTPADTLFDILTNLLIKPVEAQEAVIDQNTLPIDITSGQNYQCFIGNKRLVPKAYISKTNNALGNLSPGGQVTYTIKVRILDADIADLKITDLLSNGFIYRPGSYYIVKNGSQDITSLVPEAEYHSPGVWSIGNLLAGDYIELSYIADIDSNQATGKYTDLAWAMGKVVDSDDTIVALADPQGQISDNFVGTVVPILKPLSPSSSVDVENEVIRQTEGQVLGATTLPATGASLIWILFSVISFMVGLFFIKKSSSMAKTLSVLFFIILSLSFIRPARAMSNLSVRLQEPKSQVNTSDVNLTFVALDILGRSITVDCLKKSPTDSTFQKFGDSITVIPGGNSGQCNLSSILTTPGSYQFMVTVNVGSESSSSQVVSLDYITSSPGSPVDYRKEEPNDCDYKIHFKTADDSGKTTRVEIYRSDLTSFIADAGSLISSITIGSNQEYDLTNSVPDCSKTYYYALRAFDSAGSGSGIVGDRFDRVVYTESQTNVVQENLPGALAVEGVILAQGGESSNTDQIGQTGQTDQDSDTQTDDQGQVLGSQTLLSFVNKHKNMAIFIVVFVIVAITYVYFAKKKKR